MFLKDHDLGINSAAMLDVSRSDSQRSDSSTRPRVSFNRDVRIKKIGNSDAASIVEALAGDGEGHLVPTPVRREKIKASKRELALEADRVLKQADSVASLHSAEPPRRQQRHKPDGLQRKSSFGGTDSKKWNSEGKLASYSSLDRPKNRIKKREHTWEDNNDSSSTADMTWPRKSSGSKLKRSVSDVSDRTKPLINGQGKDQDKRSISLFGTIERIKKKLNNNNNNVNNKTSSTSSYTPDRTPRMTEPPPPPPPIRGKKQLSPIIESSPRDEYFKYSNDPFDGMPSPSRPVRRGQKVDRIVRQLSGEPPRPPPKLNRPDAVAHVQHNGNEPFSYTATAAAASPTIVHLPDATQDDGHQYRTANTMDDTWLSYEDLSHRRDALESRLQKRAASTSTIRPTVVPATPDTYATLYKKNETLGGGDRYFERKIVTEHRFARRTPRLSGEDGDTVDRPSRTAVGGRPTVVSRNNVSVVNGPSSLGGDGGHRSTGKPAKKRSRLDKFKMLFTGSSKENKRPPSSKVSNSDPESYTSSTVRKRYNVYTGDNGQRKHSPNKHSEKSANNPWFKSLDRFGKKNNKRSKTFTSGSENDDEVRVHRINDRNNTTRSTARSYHSVGNLNSLDMDHSPPRRMTEKRHSLIDSSAGSTTEGDSSQKSHKSTVYLHATTVGEIPESRQLHQSVFGTKSKRAASREELSSKNDAFGGTQKRTLSRSVSVLAPWTPRHHEGQHIDYDEYGRPPRAPKKYVKVTKSDPEEVARPTRQSRPSKSSGEESSLMDEVIIRTTSRSGELVKDGRSGRGLGRSTSSANKYTPNSYRSKTKS